MNETHDPIDDWVSEYLDRTCPVCKHSAGNHYDLRVSRQHNEKEKDGAKGNCGDADAMGRRDCQCPLEFTQAAGIEEPDHYSDYDLPPLEELKEGDWARLKLRDRFND
jgi:hypothetical protein